MKRRICVRSMGLGAVIMFIGLAVGAIVSPPLIAQRNGVFEKITCREIKVIDKDGNEAIRLYTTKHGGDIRMESKDGGIASMGIDEHGGVVGVVGKDSGSGAVMHTREHGGVVKVMVGKGIVSAAMSTDEHGGVVGVMGKDGEITSMGIDEHGGIVSVFNNQGKPRAVMGITESGNGVVNTWDKNGYRQ